MLLNHISIIDPHPRAPDSFSIDASPPPKVRGASPGKKGIAKASKGRGRARGGSGSSSWSPLPDDVEIPSDVRALYFFLMPWCLSLERKITRIGSGEGGEG